MKGFAVVINGFEKIAASELSEFGASSFSSGDGLISFEAGNLDVICRIAYSAQSVSRVCILVLEFTSGKTLSSTVASAKKSIGSFSMDDWSDFPNFSLECERSGMHDFTSQDFVEFLASFLSEKSGRKLDFRSKFRLFSVISGKNGFLGIDLSGFDLSRREYRIFGHASDLKSTAAYSLVRLSGFTSKTPILDPFSRSGSIAIEAALFASGISPNFYRKESFAFIFLKKFSGAEKFFASADKASSATPKILNFSPSMAYLRSAEKNAKIAGINKSISFSRIDSEFVEFKFERGSIGIIVSYPPMVSKAHTEAYIRKLYASFFKQASFILSKSGKIVLVSRDETLIREVAAENGFVLSESIPFSMGSESRAALILVRK